MVRFLLMLPLVLALSGCATALVAPDRPAEVGNDVTVMPQRAWNRLTNDPEAWTTQGPQIDLIRFFSGIRSGDALLAGVRGSRFDFDAKMLPNDIQDLVIATLQLEGNKAVRADNLAPCPFGGDKGFCFDLAFVSADDLEMKGLAIARKHDGRLDLFLFQAASEYYYGEMISDVRKLFASAQTQ